MRSSIIILFLLILCKPAFGQDERVVEILVSIQHDIAAFDRIQTFHVEDVPLLLQEYLDLSQNPMDENFLPPDFAGFSQLKAKDGLRLNSFTYLEEGELINTLFSAVTTVRDQLSIKKSITHLDVPEMDAGYELRRYLPSKSPENSVMIIVWKQIPSNHYAYQVITHSAAD